MAWLADCFRNLWYIGRTDPFWTLAFVLSLLGAYCCARWAYVEGRR